MIHLQFIHLVKFVSDLINVICGNNICQGHWCKCSNFCIKYINVCQASIKLFLFLRDIIFYWPWKFIKSISYKNTWHTCICQAFVNNSQWHTQLLYMTFEWLIPIKRAEVYASWRNTLTDLSVSASDLATSSQDKIEEIFRQVSFPWHCYIAHTHTRLYKAVYYRKKSISTIEYLHYKSFSNLCVVADWLIISGLNAILSCASSFIKYNIHVNYVVLWMMDLMNFHGQWNMISLNKKRNSLILSWHTLIYFMQKLEQFRQCPWQKFFPHITLIRSEAPREGGCASLIPENNAFISPNPWKKVPQLPENIFPLLLKSFKLIQLLPKSPKI